MPPSYAVPDWIEIHAGGSPLLLFAPHGGRRSSPRLPGHHKVNDLYTAELTRELAALCDATSIVNSLHDRNELDLNRVEQVRRRAPWLLRFLADTIEKMVTRSGHATVLAIHGWNVVQSACDVGIGLHERDGWCTPARDGACTVSERFVATTLRPLQRMATALHIAVTIGARYPAANANNLLQLFTPARAGDGDPAIRSIAALAASGRLDAAQLELGIPLRWPGPHRAAFTAALTQMFGSAGRAPQGRRPPIRLAAPRRAEHGALGCGGRVTRRRGLQFVDGDLIGMTSIDAGEAGSIAGRLLLSPEGERVALFTGELAQRDVPAWHIPRLQYFDEVGGTTRVCYEGPLITFRTLTPFLDLESGLAASDLLEGALDLLFTPAHVPGDAAPESTEFGLLTGTMTLADGTRTVRTMALLSDGPVPTRVRYPFLRLTFPATPIGRLQLTSLGDTTDGEGAPLPDPAAGVERRLTLELGGYSCSDAGHEPVRGMCELVLAPKVAQLCATIATASTQARRLEGVVERMIPVRRPGRAGTVIQTIYALCRLPGLPSGWMELALEHAAPPVA